MKRKVLLFIVSMCANTLLLAQEVERQYAFDNYHRYYSEGQKAGDSEKKKVIEKLRKGFYQSPYRYFSLISSLTVEECMSLLNSDGVFSDLKLQEDAFKNSNSFEKPYSKPQQAIGLFLTEAFNRIWKIADGYRTGKTLEGKFPDKLWKAIVHYGNIEIGRPNDGPRFHASCFAIPTAAVNIYFCFLDEMNRAEKDETSKLIESACDMLKVVGLQAWTQPLRHDETDGDVVSVSHFRKHVWWVGGNALAYRSLLPVAAMYRSVPMIGLLSDICQKAISETSQNTYDQAFWTEGFTADGAGWGHGKQCLVWGYPIDGVSNALNILTLLKDTPWAKRLNQDNVKSLLNYLRGSSWYYYKGYRLPCLDRGSYVYNSEEKPIPYAKMLHTLVLDWMGSFTPAEQKELLLLQKEVTDNRIDMLPYGDGKYHGIRWFFNNDDLIKKDVDCHIIVNMSSVRCDGLESAVGMADEYNFYPTDGMTLFQRDGNEYYQIMGGWDVTASPGVTAREGMNRLVPVTNWRGYCSEYNYAAGATDGETNGVAGYIFEKMNAAEKENVNDKGDGIGKNAMLYGFKAYKSYFILGDYFVALGAGVTNMKPEIEGHLQTTLDQTAWTADVCLVSGGKEVSLNNGVHSLSGIESWVVQKGKFAYRILPEFTDKAFVACETCRTDWGKMNSVNRKRNDLPKQVNILRIWADHGQTPVNETYGYVVYTGVKLPKDDLPFNVLCNDTLIQAVCSKDKKLVEAVFYPGNKGLSNNNVSLSVSSPCAVLIKQEKRDYLISVTDACMNKALKEITLVYNGREIAIPLFQGYQGGKSSVIRISMD